MGGLLMELGWGLLENIYIYIFFAGVEVKARKLYGMDGWMDGLGVFDGIGKSNLQELFFYYLHILSFRGGGVGVGYFTYLCLVSARLLFPYSEAWPCRGYFWGMRFGGADWI